MCTRKFDSNSSMFDAIQPCCCNECIHERVEAEERAKQKLARYGMELVLDLHECDVSTFNRESLDKYFGELCEAIDMTQCERFWWDDIGVPEEEQQQSPHTKGTSAVQFILTSSIVIHTLELTGKAYVNIFSCKAFNTGMATEMTKLHFAGTVKQKVVLDRL